MPLITSGVQYSGLWTRGQQMQAVAASTWTGLPQLYSWGYNLYGQLGLGNTTNYSSPKQVGSSTWLAVGGSAYSTAAINSSGALFTWGRNNYGQLGLGNITNYSSPKQVGTLTNWASISSSPVFYHFLAVKTDGTLWAWGRGDYGQLGRSSLSAYSSPVQVGALTNWLKVATGGYSSFAIKTDGTLWSWGWNAFGQLGLGNTTNYSSPKQIGSGTNWYYVNTSLYGVIATKTDGTIWSWGFNSQGQLGLGDITNRSSPVQIGALTNWLNTAGVYATSYAIKTDGTLWAWGYGAYGQLGNGSTANTSSPIQVGALTNWLSVASGYAYSGLAVKTDGTLWFWGFGGNGENGFGNLNSYSSPKQLGSGSNWKTTAFGNGYALAIG